VPVWVKVARSERLDVSRPLAAVTPKVPLPAWLPLPVVLSVLVPAKVLV
jgi:hypothetical protein